MESFLSGRPFVRTSDEGVPSVAQPPAQGFQPFLASVAPAAAKGEGAPAGGSPSLPRVDVVQENGIIRRIIVTCQCCKEIQLECVYDESAAPAPAPGA